MFKNIFSLLLCTVFISAAIAQPAKSATDSYDEGMKLLDSKQYKEALAAFKSAATKKPDYADALYEAGWCSNELEQYSNSVTYLEKAKKLSPSQVAIVRLMTMIQRDADSAEIETAIKQN